MYLLDTIADTIEALDAVITHPKAQDIRVTKQDLIDQLVDLRILKDVHPLIGSMEHRDKKDYKFQYLYVANPDVCSILLEDIESLEATSWPAAEAASLMQTRLLVAYKTFKEEVSTSFWNRLSCSLNLHKVTSSGWSSRDQLGIPPNWYVKSAKNDGCITLANFYDYASLICKHCGATLRK